MDIEIIESCHLDAPRMFYGCRAVVDGVSHSADIGAWTFYISELNAKILHSFHGRCHCIHRSAPDRDRVEKGSAVIRDDRYSLTDWRAIYGKTAARRTAENYITALRLQDRGLGPKVTGCIAVRDFTAFYCPEPSRTYGLLVGDLGGYRRKPRTTLAQLESAGLAPDRSLSCLRQQIRGYVSDLNSVVGVIPVDAEEDVRRVQHRLERWNPEGHCGRRTRD